MHRNSLNTIRLDSRLRGNDLVVPDEQFKNRSLRSPKCRKYFQYHQVIAYPADTGYYNKNTIRPEKESVT
jgi:hypothetical protein